MLIEICIIGDKIRKKKFNNIIMKKTFKRLFPYDHDVRERNFKTTKATTVAVHTQKG